MSDIKFTIRNLPPDVVFLTFELNGIMEPTELALINPPDVVTIGLSGKGVILSGRGPIWLYGYLIHFYHPAKFVATHDPRFNGAIVVESHTPDIQIGDVVEIPKDIYV
ncbi:CRISPR-associated ring nuclease Crn3/Csx3 [uncultured Mucilaginibacter sp.]|uniref:CRISPR-associated ring nuclease Crn3/Csx3 n=1 Tax=uncultured Mucilaginibacter sp. TaxID=797541 RepID=UPI0025EEC050|nr:CRISPR-associated ring nuclease Crn3/Csx3 [uncultured Mucilaginibacter sp.]